MAPLRCHLLIGPPASGKTTLARALAQLLSGPDEPPALVLSTDAIRAEVFGDAAVQGPWADIQQRLQQRLLEAVAEGRPVIVDATHARRAWRLAITQALPLPRPVEWIGWWLHTPLPICLEWNGRRQRLVPVAVIQEMAAALADPHFGPCRAEGFAAICAVVPNHHQELAPLLAAELAALDKRIRSARARESKLQRHGYSRLLDLERLLFLIRLLSSFPGLEAHDPGTREELERWLSPLPSGDLADRAAAFLRRLHGDCYGEVEAVRRDLEWLESHGFTSALAVCVPIQPPELGAEQPLRRPRLPAAGGVHGGQPPMGDGPVFVRVMTLLRHLLQNPFDRDPEQGGNLHQHLIAAMAAIPGAYLPGESASLRKDIEKILTPYGFRCRHDNVRHGYALGTALLSPPRLRQVHAVVQQAAGRLADPSAQELLQELDERLVWAGIDTAAQAPVRSYARHAVVDAALVRPDCLAAPKRAEAIERAIFEHRRVRLERYASAASFPGSPEGELRVWPLQLIFHTIGWYLIYEEDAIGREQGLIRSERLDRLALRHNETDLRRSPEQHQRAVQRLEKLLHHTGGIYFGDDLEAQLALASTSAQQRASQLETLRFSCTPWAFAFLREGAGRYPLEQTRFSRPLSGDRWWHHPRAPHVLQANGQGDSHPYPVEFDLPRWTLASDIDLRNWLFGFGAGIRIEQPLALRQEWMQRCQEVLAVHGIEAKQATAAIASEPEPAAADPEPPPRFFPNRLQRR